MHSAKGRYAPYMILGLAIMLGERTLTADVTADDCTMMSPCSCQFSDGTQIDLSPISSHDVNNPAFADIPGPSTNDMYSWNPCTDFQEGEDNCKNVAVCNIHQNIPNSAYFNLGPSSTASFSTSDTGQVALSYQYVNGTVSRSSHIALMCDNTQDGTFIPLGPLPDPSSPDYFFELHSKYTCYGSTPSGGTKGGISTGTILCIGLLVVVIVYVTGGTTFNVFYRKNTGVERIPNVSFWTTLPGLVKDGCKFLVTRGSKTTVYDKV